jgi:hypothetical protein
VIRKLPVDATPHFRENTLMQTPRRPADAPSHSDSATANERFQTS